MPKSAIPVHLHSAPLCLALAAAVGRLARGLPARLAAVSADLRTAATAGAADPAVVDHALVLGAWVALLAATCWAALLAFTAWGQAAGSVRAARALQQCCPRSLRRPLLLACGVAVAAGVPTAAAGVEHDVPAPPPTGLAGLPRPDRPVGTVPALHRLAAPHPLTARAPATLAVRPGDSLWRLVADRHPHADPATLARQVEALYRTNRAVIGDDPDLIHPGQRLRVSDRPPGDPDPGRTSPRRHR